MNYEQLAFEIAKGIGFTGVEGSYDSVTCSTAGDYPSMGFSQWEGLGGRGDLLLSSIPGGDVFVGRTYSDIVDSGSLESLMSLLGSEEGQLAQNQILAQDCLESYVPSLAAVEGFNDSYCMLYAGIWCPTSHNVVRVFLQNRVDRGYNINDLGTIYRLFFNEYAIAAGCEDYMEGYQNRATNTYNYVSNLDLSCYS